MERIRAWLDGLKFDTQLQGKELLQAAACVAVLMVLAWYNFVHLPLTASADEATAELGKNKAELLRLINFSNAHLDMAAYEQAVVTAEEAAARSLPEELATSEFISILQRTALAHRISIIRIAPAESIAHDGVLELPLTVTLRADYFPLLEFLQAVESSPRFLLVKNATIELTGSDLECKITIAIFAQPPVEVPGKT